MRILIMHHVEPMWEEGYKKKGTSFHRLDYEIARELNLRKFDKVILTRFEEWRINSSDYVYLYDHIDVVHDYAYGWCMESIAHDDEKAVKLEWEIAEVGHINHGSTIYCKGGSHSEIVEVPVWMQELVDDDVTICGAFDGECIEDLEIALGHLGIEFKRWNKFIL